MGGWIEAGQNVRGWYEESNESGGGCDEREGAKAWTGNSRTGNAVHRFSENAGDAHEQGLMGRVAVEGHRESQMTRAVLFEAVERAGVGDGVRADFESDVVAAKFTFVADACVDPPDGGVEEEECFGDGLEYVPEKVSAANVCELVCQDDFEFIRAQGCEGSERKQNDCA